MIKKKNGDNKYKFIPPVYLSFMEQFVVINFLMPLAAYGQRIQVVSKGRNYSVNGRFDGGPELLFKLKITCFRAVLFRRDRDSFVLIYGLQKEIKIERVSRALKNLAE